MTIASNGGQALTKHYLRTRVFISTYSARLTSRFGRMPTSGAASATASPKLVEDADMVIPIPATSSENAAEKVYSASWGVGCARSRLRHERCRRDLTIAVAGCVAQARRR